MMKVCILAMCFVGGLAAAAMAQAPFEKDVLETAAGNSEMTFLGHGTLMLTFGGQVIHVDPYSKVADYAKLPQADLILITHDHGDHLDLEALKPIRTEKTVVVLTEACVAKVTGGTVMKNGDVQTIAGLKIEAVPAYNIVNKRDNGQPYHPRGAGNGYVLTFGDKRVYVAGDTKNIPEMKNLQGIECAFLPMNLPYTMTPEMVVEAAKMLKPKILYPYHYGETDPARLVALLKDMKEIEVRIRQMK